MIEHIQEAYIKKIENNLRFIITISVFFLSVFSDIILEGIILIALYILSYIFFEINSGAYTLNNLKWINGFMLTGLGSYIIPLTLMALSTREQLLSAWEFYTLSASLAASLVAILIIPILVLLMVLIFPLLRKNAS